ncbi:Hypothetical predicted protein [Prunus dulcis]|uniref:Uncharacterized protein n=1 Tax=Prunus dulcis TaxID=3755 RepID=A0A5E4GGP5_PRUDU|nr:Hypothetical predicted protein [Prunus dulcis]
MTSRQTRLFIGFKPMGFQGIYAPIRMQESWRARVGSVMEVEDIEQAGFRGFFRIRVDLDETKLLPPGPFPYNSPMLNRPLRRVVSTLITRDIDGSEKEEIMENARPESRSGQIM